MTTTSPWWLAGGRARCRPPLLLPPSRPWRHTAGPPGASSPAPRCPSRRPPSCPALGLSRSPLPLLPRCGPGAPWPPFLSLQTDRQTAGARTLRDACRSTLPVCPSRSVSALLPPRPLSAQLPSRCPASSAPVWPLRLALPFPPDRKTNGGRLRPAGGLLLPVRLSRSVCVSPVPLCPLHLPPPQSDRQTAGSPAPVRALPPLAAPTAPLALAAAPPVPLGPSPEPRGIGCPCLQAWARKMPQL